MFFPFRPLHLLLGLSVSLQISSQVYALKGDGGCNWAMCVNATVEGDFVTYTMTGLKEPLGWLAIGFGRRMVNTHMVIMWPNEDGSTTLSQRLATDHIEPQPVENPPRIATIVAPPPATSLRPNSTALSFQVPVNQTFMEGEDKVEQIIWAFSMSRPSRFPSSVLTEHYSAGFTRLDFSKDVAEVSDGLENEFMKHEKIVIAHGVLLSIGFLVMLPLGTLIARWGRTVTPSWFKAHWIFNMLLALPVITIGWLLGPIAVFNHKNEHLYDAHHICGVLMLFFYYAQVFLGRYIHRRKMQAGENARPHPPSNILHIICGVSLIALALFQVRSGLNEWETMLSRPAPEWARNLWNSWIVVLPMFYLGGLALIPRQIYQERNGFPAGSDYIALSESTSPQGSHLDFEVPEDGLRDPGYDKDEGYHKDELESSLPLLDSQRR